MHTQGRLIGFTVSMLCLALQATAQFPQLHFENITTAQGLSSNDVTCIYQDHEGFLWIGTHFGLNRYDGNVVQTFYHDEGNRNSLSGNDIVEVLEDHQKIFWIATKDGGLTRYDPSQNRDNQFRQFKNDPADKKSIATNRLNCLLDYSDQYLFIGAEVVTGIFLDKKTMQFTYAQSHIGKYFYPDPAHALSAPSFPPNWIHHVVANDSVLYFSFLVGGYVYEVNREGGQIILRSFNQETGTAPFSITSFVLDGDNAWLASWGKGLFIQYGLMRDTFQLPPQKKILDINDPILCVSEWNKNFMLAGSKGSGLFMINRKDFSSLNLKHDRSDQFSIASNKVNCIFKDRAGTLWIGTSNGISKYNPSQWQFVGESLPVTDDHELTHFSVNEDDEGTLRVCTDEGIYKRSAGERDFHLVSLIDSGRHPSPTYILHAFDQDFLCSENSIYRYHPSAETIEYLNLDSDKWWTKLMFHKITFQMRSAVSDTVNGHSFLIIGILGDGIGFYDLIHHKLITHVHDATVPTSIPNNLIHAVVKDRKGEIWVGTAGGLFRWNKSYPLKNDFTSFLNFPGNDSTISGNNVSGIYADEQNHLWVTTMGDGLNEFDGKIFHHYASQTPAGNNMLGIYPDRHHRYWIPTSEGFEVFDAAAKKFNDVTVPNPEWILKYPARLLIRKDGAFCYGAGDHLVTFYPDSFYFETTPPKIYLTDFKVMDESIFKTPAFNNLSFSHGKNFFTINFSSLQFASSAIRYQYQLAGLNDAWVATGTDGKASFTSLPAGSYTFKVKVTDASGAWSNPTDLVSFTVLPPYWQQWWFYVLLTVLIVAVTSLINRLRLMQIKRLQSVRNNIANDLHDDVGSALSTINLYSEVAKMKSGSEQNGLQEVLDKISSTSQEMQENMNYIVWSIQPRNDRFDQMVLRMKRYAIDMLQPKNITVSFVFDENLNSIKLTQEKRKELFLIFKEVIHNITKYAQCVAVTIFFGKKGNEIVMEINDDGIGFKKEEVVSGNGLYTMHERARTLKGDLKISSRPESGTRVTLTFLV